MHPKQVYVNFLEPFSTKCLIDCGNQSVFSKSLARCTLCVFLCTFQNTPIDNFNNYVGTPWQVASRYNAELYYLIQFYEMMYM